MTFFTVLFVATGLLTIILGIPMLQGRVKPNNWYGFRTRATLESPDIWYPANAYAGRLLVWLGVAIILASLLLALLPGISEDAYALLATGVLMLGLLIVVVLSLRYAKALENEASDL
ncbi:MAG TPA: SdpI family protein [Caldilineae bacterium]|nr:SdpI family protein [Caldilineae bacterium]